MKTQVMKINGINFNYNGTITQPSYSIGSYPSIYTAYGRPSTTKIEIWNDWYNFFNQEYCHAIAVDSRNCFMFTIVSIFNYNGITYYAHIYPTHNELWKISE